MTPHLTSRGRALLLCAAVYFATGTAATLPAFLVVAEVSFALLAVAYLLSIIRLWSIEGRGLSMSLRLAEDAAQRGLHSGETLAFELDVENLSRLTYARLSFEANAPSGVRFAKKVVRTGLLLPRTAAEIRLEAKAVRAGRWVVHGLTIGAEDLLGFVRVSTYVPTRTPVRIMPTRSFLSDSTIKANQRRAMMSAMGLHLAKRRGFGSELREVREYEPGDPFRNILWKQTARTRTLMVRQHEDELVADTSVVLDVSPTMRGGDDHTKFEHALALTHDYLHAMASQRDRTALVTFDESLYGVFEPDNTSLHYRRLTSHLLGLNNVVAEPFTELDDEDVIAAVVRYLLVQERLDFRRPTNSPEFEPDGLGRFHVDLLVKWIRAKLPDELAVIDDEARLTSADPSDGEWARLFAWARGIEIPYRVRSLRS